MISGKKTVSAKTFPNKYRKKIYLYGCVLRSALLILLILPMTLQAQMFSIEEPERRARPSTNSFTAGPEFLEMSLRGEGPATGRVYNFTEPVYMMRLDLPGVEIYGGFRNRMGDADSLNYLNLGANISGALPLTRSRRYGVSLPLWLSTDYTLVRETGGQQPESDQFRQSSASIGVGAGVIFMPAGNIRLRAEFVPQIGFAISSMGSDAGQIGLLNGRVRLNLDQLFRRYGLEVVYRYTWKRYSGTGEQFLYDTEGHHIGLGLTF